MKLPLHRDLAHRLGRELHAATLIVRDLQALVALGQEHTPDADGFGHGGSADGGSRSTDATSTTERAALSPVDPGTRALADAIEHFLAASKHLAAAQSRLEYYRSPRERTVGRASSVATCPACGELALPRVISGYCPACYQWWYNHGMPDRAQFERERKTRAQRAEGAA